MQTFLFYDIETTGLSKPFDQVLQFAAIRTDTALQPLEQYELRVRLSPDVIPAPGALLTHRLGIHDLQQGISEYEAICKIHQWLNVPQTISVGYNSLGFDDEFLRFSFYRHLLPPYTHQYANNCGRMDIYPLTLMYFLFQDAVLNWPEVNGRVSLKLENLNAANGLFDGKAHDALSDVEMTLELARRLARQETVWSWLQGYFQKTTDLKRIQSLQHEPALLIRSRLGTEDRFQCPVLFLGEHRHYRNQLMWLRLDSPRLRETTPETIANTAPAFRKKPGEPDFLLPFTPKYARHLSAERIERTEQNRQWLQNNPSLLEAIRTYHREWKWPILENTDTEARLYINGFMTPVEEKFSKQFHATPHTEKAALTEKAPSDLTHILGTRILAKNFPELLSPSLKSLYESFRSGDVPVDYQGNKRLTRPEALAAVATLREDPKHAAGDDRRILDEYEAWLTSA